MSVAVLEILLNYVVPAILGLIATGCFVCCCCHFEGEDDDSVSHKPANSEENEELLKPEKQECRIDIEPVELQSPVDGVSYPRLERRPQNFDDGNKFVYHKVRDGDTVMKLAIAYRVSVNKIRRLNPDIIADTPLIDHVDYVKIEGIPGQNVDYKPAIYSQSYEIDTDRLAQVFARQTNTNQKLGEYYLLEHDNSLRLAVKAWEGDEKWRNSDENKKKMKENKKIKKLLAKKKFVAAAELAVKGQAIE